MTDWSSEETACVSLEPSCADKEADSFASVPNSLKSTPATEPLSVLTELTPAWPVALVGAAVVGCVETEP